MKHSPPTIPARGDAGSTLSETRQRVPKWIRVLLPALLIVLWLATAAAGGPYFGKVSEVPPNDQTSYLPSSADATQVQQLLGKFNDILKFPGADPAVPLFGFIFLVALGIDYNFFLMTRVREKSMKHGTRDGIVRGLAITGGVITSVGLVLAATFAALAVIPILFLVLIAFIVAFGVLLDTLWCVPSWCQRLSTTSDTQSGGHRSTRGAGPSRKA